MRTLFSALAVVLVCAPAWALGLADLTEGQAAGGLRQALTQGADKAVELLGRKGGFLDNRKVRIGLPKALEQTRPVLELLGQGKELDRLETAMNRAAEAAVPEARQLLVDAVRQMSVDDAKRILAGGDDSVTRYFEDKTRAALTERFLPVVSEQTGRLELAGRYNKLAGRAADAGLLEGDEASVERYVTARALDGLYLTIAEQERRIRANPLEAAGDLARKVFGAL